MRLPRLDPADALLVVPPGAHVARPSLGAHALQAWARRAGLRVEVLYANAAFAAAVGPDRYEALCDAPLEWLLVERLFAPSAWGTDPLAAPALARDLDAFAEMVARRGLPARPFTLAELRGLAREAAALVEAVGEVARAYPVVGATTTFGQVTAGAALLRAARAEGARTLMGGRACDAPMGGEIARIAPWIDAVVSGEADRLFPELLARALAGDALPRAVEAGLLDDLDEAPTPALGGFLAQLEELLPGAVAWTWLALETSRGCEWGDRHPCRFCGVVGPGMRPRRRSARRVVDDLRELTAATGLRRVDLADNALPRSAFADLLPRLAAEGPSVELSCEVRPTLSLADLRALRAAGVRAVQPGLESLSTASLRRMGKGTTAPANLAFLRRALSVGLEVRWVLLFGVPGDDREELAHALRLLPLLRHLPPPAALGAVALERGAIWRERAAEWGITGLRPKRAWAEVYPAGAEAERLSPWFDGDVPSGTLAATDLQEELAVEVAAWRAAWARPPVLRVTRAGPGFALVDTRGGEPAYLPLDQDRARAVLAEGPPTPARAWALRRGYAVELDGRAVPLAVAAPDLLEEVGG